MEFTAEYKLPYPDDEEAPDGPTQVKALAEALDKIQWLEKAIKDGAATSRKVKLTSGLIRSTAELALKDAWQTLNGTTLVIPKASFPVKMKLLVVTAFGFQCTGRGSHVAGTVEVDGKRDEVNTCTYGWGNNQVQSNFDGLTESYEYELKPNEDHTIALAASGHKGGLDFDEISANKGCSALWFLHAV